MDGRCAHTGGDELCLGVGLEDEYSRLLLIAGARANGANELLATRLGRCLRADS